MKENKKEPEPKKKSSPAPSGGSAAANGVEDKEQEELNGDKEECGALQPASAFSSDCKACNTNPHLNALSADEASVCTKEV